MTFSLKGVFKVSRIGSRTVSLLAHELSRWRLRIDSRKCNGMMFSLPLRVTPIESQNSLMTEEGVAATTHTVDSEDSWVVPAVHVVLVDQLVQFTLRQHGVTKVLCHIVDYSIVIIIPNYDVNILYLTFFNLIFSLEYSHTTGRYRSSSYNIQKYSSLLVSNSKEQNECVICSNESTMPIITYIYSE